jgi:hypothetical protein
MDEKQDSRTEAKKCLTVITESIKVRMIVTIPVLFLVCKKFGGYKHILILLPLLLILLDGVDRCKTYRVEYKGFKNGCKKTFTYQIRDKVADLLTYLYVFSLFPLDQNLLYLTLFRALGVFLFYKTKSSYWLVIFFDFVKEYMVYKYFFENNYRYIPVAVSGKIIFEYIFHSMVNKSSYKENE